MALTIAEAAAQTGITTHTLRYYERVGLLPPVARAHSGHRRYGDDDLRMLDLLKRLQASGMPIRKMQDFARLVRGGKRTLKQRRAALAEHLVDVEARITELKATAALLKKKIARYDEA